MTREQKIAEIWDVCTSTSPTDPQVASLVRLRHVLAAFRAKKMNYTIGAQGFFIDPSLLTATHARWNAFQNDLILQDDSCIDFLYERFISVGQYSPGVSAVMRRHTPVKA